MSNHLRFYVPLSITLMIKNTGLFYVFLVLLSASSCTDKSTALNRTWRITDLKYTKEVPAEMKPAIDKSLDEMRQNFSITYNSDGTYFTKMGESSIQGKWKLNWNSSKLSVVTSTGESKEYSVMMLDEHAFSFKAIEGGEEVIFELIPDKK